MIGLSVTRKTEWLFADQVVRDFEGIARRAKRKLEAVSAAARLANLQISYDLELARWHLSDDDERIEAQRAA